MLTTREIIESTAVDFILRLWIAKNSKSDELPVSLGEGGCAALLMLDLIPKSRICFMTIIIMKKTPLM